MIHFRRQAHHLARSSQGFSIIELIVSITIFVTLSTLLIANFYRGRQADDLRISAQEFAGYMRRVQNLSTAGQSIMVGGSEKVPPGGYGISIEWAPNVNSYSMFADIAHEEPIDVCDYTSPITANSQYDMITGDPNCDKLIEAVTVTLKPSVVFNRIKVKAPSGETEWNYGLGGWNAPADTNNRVDIAFRPPKPIPVLDGETGRTIQIELKHVKTDQTRTVTIIGASGQISERLGSLQ